METAVGLNLTSIFPVLCVMAVVTFLTRSIVFYGFQRLAEWPSLRVLGEHLPSCALLILSSYALRSTLGHQPDCLWPILVGLLVLTVVHVFFRRILLSLVLGMGTVVGMMQVLAL